MPNLLRHKAVEEIKRCVGRELSQLFVLACVLSTIGLGLVLMYIGHRIPVAIFGLLLLSIGTWFFYRWRLIGYPENAAIWQYLNQHPQKIVWVYHIVTDIMPFGIALFSRTTVILKTIDDKELTLRLPRRKRRMVLFWLKRYLPHASFGYSTSLDQQYQIDPTILIHRTDGEKPSR